MVTDPKPSSSVKRRPAKTPPWIKDLGIETNEAPVIETDGEPVIETEGEPRPSLLKAIGSVLFGMAIWAWFGFLYFTGGDCALEGLEIECVSRSLTTTINLPVAIIGLFFGLVAILGGLGGILAVLSPKAEDADPQV
jgi:hypothetical protein